MEDVRLGEVVRQVKRAEEPTPGTVYRQAGVRLWGEGAYERDTIDGADTKYKHFFQLREGDLVVNKIWARNGSVAVVPQELDGCYVSSEFPTFEADRSRVLPEWLYWIAKSPILWDQFDEKSFGTSGKNRIQPKRILAARIPLPSVDEQRDRVGHVEETVLLSRRVQECLHYSASDLALLRQRILQDAVQGKLTQRDPDDEPASALLQRIEAEKKRLYKAGEIRKPKKLSPVEKDEPSAQLPQGWEWARLGSLIDPERHVSYGVLVPGPDQPDGVPFVRAQDLAIENPPARPTKSISPEVDAKYERTRLRGDELLLCVVGSIGKLGVAHPGWAGANIARAVCRIVPAEGVDRSYLLALLRSPVIQGYFESATRTLAQPTLNVSLINDALVPVPPLGEQRRIAERADQLMALCDGLEAKLAASERDAERLMRAALEEALAVPASVAN